MRSKTIIYFENPLACVHVLRPTACAISAMTHNGALLLAADQSPLLRCFAWQREYIVATFKLLSIHLDINLSWSVHINSITSKASKRLYFLKQLKRGGVPQNQLLHFYTAVIRPVLEYAAPVWHHLINRTQAHQLESVQKRAIHIIYNITRGMSYPNMFDMTRR